MRLPAHSPDLDDGVNDKHVATVWQAPRQHAGVHVRQLPAQLRKLHHAHEAPGGLRRASPSKTVAAHCLATTCLLRRVAANLQAFAYCAP